MERAEADLWACAGCRSINGRRADRCYRCHAPRAVATVNPADMPFVSVRLQPPTAAFKSSRARAVAVTVAVLALIVSGALAAWSYWSVIDLRLAVGDRAADDLLGLHVPVFAALLIAGTTTLVAYAAWMSRIVDNLPAVGAGYSQVGPRMAIAESFLPGVNVLAIAARMFEVLHKLEGMGLGTAMLGVAVMAGLGPVAAAAWILRFGRFVETGGELMRTGAMLIVAIAAGAMVALVIALGLVWRIERLCLARTATVEATE